VNLRLRERKKNSLNLLKKHEQKILKEIEIPKEKVEKLELINKLKNKRS
jgi:hypothetical protein